MCTNSWVSTDIFICLNGLTLIFMFQGFAQKCMFHSKKVDISLAQYCRWVCLKISQQISEKNTQMENDLVGICFITRLYKFEFKLTFYHNPIPCGRLGGKTIIYFFEELVKLKLEL